MAFCRGRGPLESSPCICLHAVQRATAAHLTAPLRKSNQMNRLIHRRRIQRAKYIKEYFFNYMGKVNTLFFSKEEKHVVGPGHNFFQTDVSKAVIYTSNSLTPSPSLPARSIAHTHIATASRHQLVARDS